MPESWKRPIHTADVNGLAAIRIPEENRRHSPESRFYQASSNEMFANVTQVPQSEDTPFNPRNPYGFAKVFAHEATGHYRNKYGNFACSGISFNHESPRRGMEFVTRKLTNGVARIKLRLDNERLIGNLDATRDWGYAPEYVEAMWRMLQHDEPGDYVIATSQTHSVRALIETAFNSVGLNWEQYVEVDKRLYRFTEAFQLVGDANKARDVLGRHSKVTFGEMVELMVKANLESLKADLG